MKIASTENPNHWASASSNRAHGAVGQNRSCSFTWAAKQEKFQPQGTLFPLTSTFIELNETDRGVLKGSPLGTPTLISSAFTSLQWKEECVECDQIELPI